jgi:hypothetical protein
MFKCRPLKKRGGRSVPDESHIVRELVAKSGIPLTGSIIKDARPGNYYFAIVPLTRHGDGRQEPSSRRLEEARLSLLAQGYQIDFVLSERQTSDVEGGLRAALTTAYGDSAVSVAVAFQGRRATVWVEMADSVMSEAMVVAVREKIDTYFASFEVAELAVQITSQVNLPSILACLRVIRQLAPVNSDTLSTALQVAGFNVPSPEWLSHRLDAMRKSGRLVRLRDGLYTLTADALQKLGTAKGRTSPDVTRMLALARRSR